jgi:Immunity protein 8
VGEVITYKLLASANVDDPTTFRPSVSAFSLTIAFSVKHPQEVGSDICYIYVTSRAFVEAELDEFAYFLGRSELIVDTYDIALVSRYIDAVIAICAADDSDVFFERMSRYVIWENDKHWIPESLLRDALRM